jgi:hypothetical protein
MSLIASERTGDKNAMYNKTHKESSKKIMSSKKIGIYNGINNPRSRKLYQYDMDNNLLKIWDFCKECADYYNLSRGNISTYAKNNTKVDIDGIGKYKMLNKFIFKFH